MILSQASALTVFPAPRERLHGALPLKMLQGQRRLRLLQQYAPCETRLDPA